MRNGPAEATSFFISSTIDWLLNWGALSSITAWLSWYDFKNQSTIDLILCAFLVRNNPAFIHGDNCSIHVRESHSSTVESFDWSWMQSFHDRMTLNGKEILFNDSLNGITLKRRESVGKRLKRAQPKVKTKQKQKQKEKEIMQSTPSVIKPSGEREKERNKLLE